MVKKLSVPVIGLVALGLLAANAGCQAEAKIGNTEAKAPEPPPPPPPPPAPPPAPAPAPPPAAAPLVVAPANVKLEGHKVKIPGELEFDVDKATLKNNDATMKILNTLVEFMKTNPKVTKLRVEGHTDDSGKPDHNMTLSQQRADAVAKWLGEHGVDKVRLKTVGFGQTKQLVANDTKEHKEMNRRTEFHVDELEGKPATAGDDAANSSGATSAPPAGAPAAPAAVKKEEKKDDKKAPAAVTAPKK